MNIQKIIGPPGTGKTTRLLKEVSQAMDEGVDISEIMYVTYTRKAIQEAVERFTLQRTDLCPKDFIWFKTIHAFAYFSLGLDKHQVINDRDLESLLPHVSSEVLEKIQAVHQRAVLTGESVEKAAQRLEGELPINRILVEEFQEALTQYKKITRKMDFNDILERYIAAPLAPQLKLLVVDEAQDLSELQWQVVNILAQNSERTLLAGDPCQAIYEWAGAGPKTFEGHPAPFEVLPKSHRVPRKVQKLADKVRNKYSGIFYDYQPAQEPGEIHHLPAGAYHQIPFHNGEDWLVLARTWQGLEDIRSYLYHHSLPWSATGRYLSNQGLDKILRHIGWYEKMLQTGEITEVRAQKLVDQVGDLRTCVINQTPWPKAFQCLGAEKIRFLKAYRKGDNRIILSTIHAAKGGEATNVVIEGRVTRKVLESLYNNPDQEAPVLYVGLTRTKKRLYLLDTPTGCGYPWAELLEV
jgi:DNA helicase-2/ATP-dependent DNA helicase PcrA